LRSSIALCAACAASMVSRLVTFSALDTTSELTIAPATR
jgi:hypothetical protein